MAQMKATTFAEIEEMTSRTGSCTLGNNTTAERNADGTITVRLHGHAIVTLRSDGSVTVTTAGWDTVTTRDRLNTFLPNIGAPLGPHRVRGALRFMSPQGDLPWNGDPLTVDADGNVIEAFGLVVI